MKDKIDVKKYLSGGVHILVYCIYAVILGAVIGFAGTYLGKAISLAANFRMQNSWIIYLLPVSGLIIVALYHIPGLKFDFGTNRILDTIENNDQGLPFAAAPLIFVATVLTHLCGGSAGRESAALLLGASLAGWIGRLVKLPHRDMRIVTMCGMAAGFTALFGTPFAACIFALEILANKIRYAALLPVFLSSISAKFFADYFGAGAEGYTLRFIPEVKAIPMLKVMLLSALTAVLSIVMCIVLEKTHELYAKYLKNPYIRVLVGGVLVAGLTILFGPDTYAGAGGNIIERAIEGETESFAFLIKLVLTALTLGAGFKGGEIVPTLFVGSTFGCFLAPLLGLDPGFAAAIAMMANFAGNTNCPLAAMALACELFKGQAILFFVPAAIISYTLSGKYSLYSNQKLMKSKFSID